MWKHWIVAGLVMAISCLGMAASAQSFMPPAGYSATGTPPVPLPPEPDAPPLTRLSDASLSDRFHVVPTYERAAYARVKVVGAFTIDEPAGTHLVAAWGSGYLPVTLWFSDGRCFLFTADYYGAALSNGHMARTNCEGRRDAEAPRMQSDTGSPLRFVNSVWGYDAWADDPAGTTLITAPYGKTFAPLYTARMTTIAIMAMNGPDWPGGNITLVGRIDGRLTVVTLEVNY